MKRISALLLILLLCLSISACAGSHGNVDPTSLPVDSERADQSENTTETAVVTAEPAHAAKRYSEVYDPYTDWNNANGRGYATFAESEEAYYYTNVGYYVYYYDKATGERGVLCNKPECMHDTVIEQPGCNGCIQCHSSWLSYYMGQLYYTSFAGCNKLFRMNIDSTGREMVIECPYETPYLPEEFYMHRGKLYGMGRSLTVKDGEPANLWYVMIWDVKTGEYTLIYEKSSIIGQARPCLFFFGDDVYFITSYFPSESEHIPQIDLFRYSTATNKLETMYSGKDENVLGINFTLWVEAEDEIYVAPTMEQIGVELAEVFKLTEGRLEKWFEFSQQGPVRLMEGGAAIVVLGGENAPFVEMRDYSGKLLYKEKLGMEFLDELAEEEGSPVRRPTCYADLGSSDKIYLVFGVKFENNTRKTCLVRYEKTDEGLEETLLCVDNWG